MPFRGGNRGVPLQYPFQCARSWVPLPFLWCPLISSTSYSSSSLIMSGGGAGSLCWLANSAFLQCVNRSLLKTLCMAHPSGSSTLYVPCPISSLIVKGLYLFWSSFFEGSLFECSLPLAILVLLLWDLAPVIFSCYIAFSLCPLSFSLLSLFLFLSFPSSLVVLPNLVFSFLLLNFLSRGVFHSSYKMRYVLLLLWTLSETMVIISHGLIMNG